MVNLDINDEGTYNVDSISNLNSQSSIQECSTVAKFLQNDSTDDKLSQHQNVRS